MIYTSITSQATEMVCFRLMSHEALRAVERLWRDSGIVATREQVASAAAGQFSGVEPAFRREPESGRVL